MKISLEQRAKPTPDVLCQQVGGEVVLLDLASERYFGLDPVGSRIWQLLDQNLSLEQVLQHLNDEYDAPREQLRDDLLDLIKHLVDSGLVSVD